MIMAPQYKVCNTCELKRSCSEYDKKLEACPIEQKMTITVLNTLNRLSIEETDKLLVLPLLQNLFRMRRYYKVESLEDLSLIMNNVDLFDIYRKKMTLLNKTEAVYIKILKENFLHDDIESA